MEEELIKDIKPKSPILKWIRRYILNKYVATILGFLVWIIFFDSNSFLVINDLNETVDRYQKQLDYYQSEYKKNNDFYQKLMNDKDEKERYARENYFMKKPNEEIFIIVVDSTKTE